jgi:L-aminopeptidase/D-esterase-like protein
MKGLTDIPGIKVGHVSDLEGITGCTAVLCESGAVAGVSIGGFATGTQELDVLSPTHITPSIHAISLAGGSAFGLEAASGVRDYLGKKGIGFRFGAAKIPIVPGAIIFDLGIGSPTARATMAMGAAAVAAATSDTVKEGCVGAGTGATVGKALGLKNAMKSGLGSATVSLPENVMVSALAVVNAMGDVIDPSDNRIIAGARKSPDSMEFVRATEAIKLRKPQPAERTAGNTTLVVVATNAQLTKVEATRLAHVAQHGLVRSISPVHTNVDGDIVFALSAGSERAEFTALGVAAAEAVVEAVLRAAKLATPMGGLPAFHR